MIRFDCNTVYLACGATDLRKQINGLTTVVTSVFELDPFAPMLFVFCNRAKNKIKVLTFDKDGFVLYFKRLERGRFIWPRDSEEASMMELDIDEFYQLLGATSLERKLYREEVKERTIY